MTRLRDGEYHDVYRIEEHVVGGEVRPYVSKRQVTEIGPDDYTNRDRALVSYINQLQTKIRFAAAILDNS